MSPYIRFVCSVWGIMNSFRGLATVQQATLATVAPGISEALIATAMGLFAAIPAVLAYNRYSASADSIYSGYQTFAEEFPVFLPPGTRLMTIGLPSINGGWWLRSMWCPTLM